MLCGEIDRPDEQPFPPSVAGNCDWIIANNVSKKNSGFESNYNEVIIHYKDSKLKKEKLSLKSRNLCLLEHNSLA